MGILQITSAFNSAGGPLSRNPAQRPICTAKGGNPFERLFGGCLKFGIQKQKKHGFNPNRSSFFGDDLRYPYFRRPPHLFSQLQGIPRRFQATPPPASKSKSLKNDQASQTSKPRQRNWDVSEMGFVWKRWCTMLYPNI